MRKPFFIKKTQEESTSYQMSSMEGIAGDDIKNFRPCNSTTDGFKTITDYEYYEADYQGKYNTDTEGFAKMGATGNLNEPGFLSWEPSWQLYKTRQTSPSVPEWEHTEEYFYIYDLINNPSYQDSDNGSFKPKRGMLRQIFDVKKRRDLVYEKRVTRSGSGGGENVHSTFYVYDDDWEAYTPGSTVIEIDNPLGDGDCGEDDGNGGGYTPAPICSIHQAGNDNLCPLPGTNLYCPCEITGGGSGNTSGFTGNSDGNGNAVSYDPDDVEEYLINYVNGNIYLKETYIQTQAEGGESTLMSFTDPADFTQVAFDCNTLKTHTIHKRNQLGQVVEEEDEKGLVTFIDYGETTVYEYDYCFEGQTYRQSQTVSPFPGLPKSITVGDNLQANEFPLTTQYVYHHSRQVLHITDPNFIELGFNYDGFNRLIEKKRNQKLIQKISYGNWANRHEDTFTERGQRNYVAVTDYVNGTEQTTNTQYIDPLGRNVYTTSDGGGSSPLVTDNYFDIYGRVELAGPPTGSIAFVDGANDTGLQGTCEGMDYILDVAPRNRPLRAAKNDLCPDGDKTVDYRYCMVGANNLVEDYLANGGNPDDFGDALPSKGVFLRTEIIDEDGKSVIEYTNALGQKTATFGGGIGGVVYSYDEFGNVNKTVNAEQQESFYRYNYLGLLYSKENVDEGTTRYSYNRSGQMTTMVTSEHSTIWGYDNFGRMTEQKQLNSPLSQDGAGLPWVGDSGVAIQADTAYTNALSSGIKEKEWYYNQAVSNAELNEGFELYIGTMDRLKGKVAQTISFDQGEPVESRLLSYNFDGFLDWETVKYLGFSSNLTYQLSYPEYNLQGSYLSQQVNLNCDGTIDFTYRYEYDGRNRIKEVGIDYPSLSVFNAKIASYTYHPSYLSVETKTLHDYEFGTGCTQEGIEAITYEYDSRQRMKSIGSELFTELLAYDGDNYNGNIDATTFQYKLDRFESVPLIFSGNTTYNYTYDGMNRLTKAQAGIGYDLIDAHLYSGNFGLFGNVNYEYDRVGNITKLQRGVIDHNLKKIGYERFRYEFEDGNNKLTTLRYRGLDNLLEEFAYSYNGVGSLASDGRRGIDGILFSRGVYPKQVADNEYLYDVNDMRIARQGAEKEYYLRDAAGKELAIFNSDKGFSWYIHGNERVAKIAADKCGDSLCRPKKPECSTEGLDQQIQQLAALGYTLDPNAMSYPTTLIRVEFCDGKDRYLLLEELKQIDGPYNILQQIALTEPNQVFTVALDDNPVQTMLLSSLLDLRENANTLLVNGYRDCAVECIDDVYNCSEAITSNQLAYLSTLHNSLANDISSLSFPDKLHRLRLCNGLEVYLPEQLLSNLPGFAMIVYTTELESLTQAFTVSINGEDSFGTTGEGILRNYLAVTNADISIDGYTPCYEDLPCDPSLPDCSLVDALSGGPDLSALVETITATTTVPAYPAKMLRLRFCDGREYYVLESELPLIANSNYQLLQQVFLTNAATPILATTTNQAEIALSPDAIISARADGTLVSLLKYETCGQVAVCDGPICSPAQTTQQTAELDQLALSFANTDVNTITYPTAIYRLRFCEGREMYFLANELPGVPSGRLVQQEIEVNSPSDIIDLVNLQGLPVPGSLANFVSLRAAEQLYTIGSFVPCRYRQQRCRTPEPEFCGPSEIADQLIVLDQIRNNYTNPSQLSYPLTLRRVALCNNREIYLLESEIAIMPHTITVLQEVPVTAAFTGDFSLWLHDGGVVEGLNFGTILNERFDDIHQDFRVIGYGCQTFQKEPDAACTYDVYVTNLQIRPGATQESPLYHATYDIKGDCEGSPPETYSTDVDIESQKHCMYMEYRFDLSELAEDNEFFIPKITLETQNPSSVLQVDLNPGTYLQTYPDLAQSYCGANQYTPSDLFINIGEENDDCNAAGVMSAVIEHAISKWAEGLGISTAYENNGSSNGPVYTDYDPVLKQLSIFLKVYHYPTAGYVNINHLDYIALGQYVKSGNNINASVHKSVKGCGAYSKLALCDTEVTINLSPLFPDELPLETADEWYTQIEDIVCCKDGGNSNNCQVGCPAISVYSFDCIDSGLAIECEDKPLYYCVDGTCEGCPKPTDLNCSETDLNALAQDLQTLDVNLSTTNTASFNYPTTLYQLRFCGDEQRYLFRDELDLVNDLNYTVTQRITIESPVQEFRVTLLDASALLSGINRILAFRTDKVLARVDPIPELEVPPGSEEPTLPSSETELFTTGYESSLQISYYLYDHLGNTRIVFHTEVDCGSKEDLTYVAEYVADYYPFGKILREWVACDQERYLTTYHERDKESGYDYRGARFYDSDLGRFLSTDPLAVDFPMWSTYTYVLDNPVRLVDPDGRVPTDPIIGKLNSLVAANDPLFDHLYNRQTVHGPNYREAGAAVVQKSDGGYRAEYFENASTGNIRPHVPELSEGEGHVADFHSHPMIPIFTTNGNDGAPFSEADLTNIKTHTEGFASFVEIKDSRLAIVILDPVAYSEFGSDSNYETHQEGLQKATLAHLRTVAKAYIAEHGSIVGFDEVGETLKAQAKYLVQNNAGVQLYRTTDSEKLKFQRIE